MNNIHIIYTYTYVCVYIYIYIYIYIYEYRTLVPVALGRAACELSYKQQRLIFVLFQSLDEPIMNIEPH